MGCLRKKNFPVDFVWQIKKNNMIAEMVLLGGIQNIGSMMMAVGEQVFLEKMLKFVWKRNALEKDLADMYSLVKVEIWFEHM